MAAAVTVNAGGGDNNIFLISFALFYISRKAPHDKTKLADDSLTNLI